MNISKDNKFIKKYKKEMVDIIMSINPDLDKDFVKSTIMEMIKENIKNPEVTLDNNYTGESRDTTLLSVLNWALTREPIIAGNGTFYMNQHESINPIAKMLEDFLLQRKAYKKSMFKIEDIESPKYKDLDRNQLNEKINCNSYYGASGAPSSAFYSLWSGPATTNTAQQVISSAETLFEGFISDNYIFLNLTELLEWCSKIMKPFIEKEVEIDSFISLKSIYDVKERLLDKIIDTDPFDEIILENYLYQFTDEELSVLYYKNNLLEFINDHENIKELILEIFYNVENLQYVELDNNGEPKNYDWMSVIPNKYREDFVGKTAKDWNSFVNTQYFMDPNNVPESIANELYLLKEYLMKYIYCKYLSVDRVYRLKNFKRKVVTVIDTDSNILSLDTSIDFIMDNIVKGNTFGRDIVNNIYICVNMLAYVLTEAVTDILLTYGECSNIPEEYRPIFNMKNEFLFLKLVIAETKKRYMSRITLREGNLIMPAKYDIKGFDFKKASCSEYAEDRFMKIIKKHILNSDSIEIKEILIELRNFKDEIINSIRKGERTYLPNASAKEIGAYKNPSSEQSVRGVLAWNILNPDNMIDLPSKVSLIKLNIFDESDIDDLKDTNPYYYNLIIDKIFNDTTGMFVSKDWICGIDEVNPYKDEWWKDIPKKFQSKYKKLGANEWNKFVDSITNDESPNYNAKLAAKYIKDIGGKFEYKKKGMQVLAIPGNATIPEWIQPYIDYSTMVNNILAPMNPVLEIFKTKTIEEGKTKKGVNRKTETFTNIVKF